MDSPVKEEYDTYIKYFMSENKNKLQNMQEEEQFTVIKSPPQKYCPKYKKNDQVSQQTYTTEESLNNTINNMSIQDADNSQCLQSMDSGREIEQQQNILSYESSQNSARNNISLNESQNQLLQNQNNNQQENVFNNQQQQQLQTQQFEEITKQVSIEECQFTDEEENNSNDSNDYQLFLKRQAQQNKLIEKQQQQQYQEQQQQTPTYNTQDNQQQQQQQQQQPELQQIQDIINKQQYQQEQENQKQQQQQNQEQQRKSVQQYMKEKEKEFQNNEKQKILEDIQPKNNEQFDINNKQQQTLKKNKPSPKQISKKQYKQQKLQPSSNDTQYNIPVKKSETVLIEDTQKIHKKVNKSKSSCFIPPASLSSQEVFENLRNQEKKQERKNTIDEAYIDRKKQSFQNLSNWNQQRLDFIEKHQNITTQIVQQINDKMQKSIDSQNAINKFFVTRRDNELVYANQLQNNTPKLQSIWNSNDNKQKQEKQNQDWYPQLTEILIQTDKIIDTQSSKVKDFAKFLDQNIIKNLLDKEQIEFFQGIRNIKQDLQKQQTSLKKQEAQTQLKSQKYSKIYQQSIDKTYKKKKDLYNSELKYRKEAFLQFDQIQQYGKKVMVLWETFTMLEQKKIDTIQKAFQMYIQAYLDTYGETKELLNIKSQVQKFNPTQQVQNNLDLKNILTLEQRQLISKAKNQNSSEMQLLNNFLYNFKFPDVNLLESGQHRLVLKKYKAYKDTGTIGLTWSPIELVFTIDDFLMIFQGDDHKKLNKSSLKLGCDRIRIQKREKNNKEQNLCYIVEKRPGVIFTSTSKILLKFENSDYLEEFKMFLHRYTPPEDLNI